MARRTIATAILLLCFAGVAGSSHGKNDYALIYGTVWSADSRAVSGVPVKILRVGDKKPKWELVSDRRGEFAQRVPPGEHDYIITAEIKNAKSGVKPQAKAHVFNNERVDVSLHLTE